MNKIATDLLNVSLILLSSRRVFWTKKLILIVLYHVNSKSNRLSYKNRHDRKIDRICLIRK